MLWLLPLSLHVLKVRGVGDEGYSISDLSTAVGDLLTLEKCALKIRDFSSNSHELSKVCVYYGEFLPTGQVFYPQL